MAVKAKKIKKYILSEREKQLLKGRRNGFVFNIRDRIMWADKVSGGKFHSKHYSPLTHDDVPHMIDDKVVYGVPDMDENSLEYDDFWDEQDRRCMEGYAPIVDGIEYPRITGAHYFYLNMFKILLLPEGKRKKVLDYPFYRVLDHMIFLELEKAERDGYGIIVGKSRRMGLSYIGSVMLYWQMLFYKDNFVAVGAGKEDKAQALFAKLKKGIQSVRPEYQVKYRYKKEELRLCYEVNVNGVREDHGLNSQVDIRTFFSDPSAFEGGSYSFFIFEEIGIHDNLIKSYKASEPCFTDGSTQFGVPFLFGTGGEVEKGSKDFKVMMANPAAYGLKKIVIPKFMFYPGSPDEEADEMDKGVNFFDMRTGLNDEEGALKHILKRRQEARKSKEGYIKEVQSNAIKESDIFLKTDGGVLNRIMLSAQREAVYNKEVQHEEERGRYEWVDREEFAIELSRCRTVKERNKVRMKHKAEVKFVPDPEGPVCKLKGFAPINDPRMPYNADIIGVDSYDEEEASESTSLGCSLVYRCFNGVSNEYDLPIAYVYERGDGSSDDTFWDNCLKQSVYWKAQSLIEYTKIAVLNYFRDVDAYEWLRENPDLSPDLVTNKGRQQYGVRMTAGKKGFAALVTKLLKLEVLDNCYSIYFEEVLDELIEYGEVNTDIAMAYGIALIHKQDLWDYITDDIDEHEVDDSLLDGMIYYQENERGELVAQVYDSPGGEKLQVFDKRKHLSGEERENYLNFVKVQQQQLEKERQKKLSALQELQTQPQDPFASLREEYLAKMAEHEE
jgi:hypothetical protein